MSDPVRLQELPPRVKRLWEAMQDGIAAAGVCCAYHHSLALSAELQLAEVATPQARRDDLAAMATQIAAMVFGATYGPTEALIVFGICVQMVAETGYRAHGPGDGRTMPDGRPVLQSYCGEQ